MARSLCALWLILFITAPLAHADPRQTFDSANQAYQKGNYAEAAEQYRKLADSGIDDAALWYNLGNAYFALDDLGRARLCYERARVLQPRDSDVEHNLDLLRKRLGEKDEDGAAIVASLFTTDELTILASLLNFAGFGLLVAFLKRRSETLAWVAGICLVLCCVESGLLMVHLDRDNPRRMAVVLQPTSTLYGGPGKEYAAGLQLHAGTLVRTLSSNGSWREVSALGASRGWLRQEEVEDVVPPGPSAHNSERNSP